jgi:hypothetical protein
MKTYDMIQKLKEIQDGLDHSIDWLQEGMGKQCGFLKLEQRQLQELVAELESDHNRYLADKGNRYRRVNLLKDKE